MVVVGVGQHDRDDATVGDEPGDRVEVVGGVDDQALGLVTEDPDVVVDVVGLPVQAERAGGLDVVDTDHAHQRTTTERRTSPRCILSKAASTSPMPIVSVTNASRSNRPCR